MNTIGRLFRINIFGESHGPAIGVIIDGCPAGITLSEKDFMTDLSKRKSGSKGTTSRKESDIPLIKSGIFNGNTTGSPLAILFENKDTNSSDYEQLKDRPRPGHADLVAKQKFGAYNDYRGGGHFSGRLTAPLVAAGVIAKKIIKPVKISAKLVSVHGSKSIEKEIEKALSKQDSVGGVIKCKVTGLPAGLGEPFFDSTESLLSHALFSIPGIKGVEFGVGFECTKLYGSECNDSISNIKGKTITNNAGGINGGITNGNELIFRVAVKPTSSILKAGKTVNLKTGKQLSLNVKGRHDSCIAIRVPVVVEAVTAIVLADLMLIEQRIRRVR